MSKIENLTETLELELKFLFPRTYEEIQKSVDTGYILRMDGKFYIIDTLCSELSLNHVLRVRLDTGIYREMDYTQEENRKIHNFIKGIEEWFPVGKSIKIFFDSIDYNVDHYEGYGPNFIEGNSFTAKIKTPNGFADLQVSDSYGAFRYEVKFTGHKEDVWRLRNIYGQYNNHTKAFVYDMMIERKWELK